MGSKFDNIAFISYKREDEDWAEWLQKKLEHYKLPTEIRRKFPNLEFSERPRHILKDTTDLSGGVLAKAIKAGLDSSKFLVVICSPRVAKSKWVYNEQTLLKFMHKSHGGDYCTKFFQTIIVRTINTSSFFCSFP